MDWSELWGQLAGGAVGVLIGFVASEWIAFVRRRREDHLTKAAVNAEMAQNTQEAGALLETLASAEHENGVRLPPDDRARARGELFAQLTPPLFISHAWDTHFVQSPGAFTESDIEVMLAYFRAAQETLATWHRYQRAVSADDGWRNSRFNGDSSTSMPEPGHLGRAIERLQPRLESALNLLGSIDTLPASGVDPAPTR